ncbi:MAG: helix-turn-helix transcriptional regulator [Alphaproteobacteria bacterium]|nr:helix-turn-helix transcriptional regulator [Alphaproteobacteria bacterium]
MAKQAPQRAIEWILREGTAEQAVPASARMTFDDEHWSASIERVDIGEGLRVYLTRAEVRRGLSLEPAQMVPGPWLSSSVAVKGRIAVTFVDDARFSLSPARSMIFRPMDGRARFAPAPRQLLRMSGYIMSAERIASHCDGDVPARLKPLLQPEVGRTQIVGVPVTALLKRVATRMLSEQITGVLRRAWLEGLALQMFAVQSALGAPAPRPLAAAERARIEEARERLLADMRNPPTAAELAAAVGLGETRLGAGFKEMFGATLFETLRNERLEHARAVLEAQALPMKVVAERVGYRHVTNFINAFTARYGTPPGVFARGRAAAKEHLASAKRRGKFGLPPPERGR